MTERPAYERCTGCGHPRAYHSSPEDRARDGSGLPAGAWFCAYPAHQDGEPCACGGFDTTERYTHPRVPCSCAPVCGLPPCADCQEDHGGNSILGRPLCRDCFLDARAARMGAS